MSEQKRKSTASTGSRRTLAVAWVMTLRPPTLLLALGAVILGLALAATRGPLDWPVASLTLLTAVLLQILANLANDWGDALSGADGEHRVGPRRAVQRGLISAAAIRRATVLVGVTAFAIGVLLLTVALAPNWRAWLAFLALGLASLAAAVAYTLGSRPYGYRGLGDVSVLVFFGWVAVLGTGFMQHQSVPPIHWLPATAAGLLAVAVLNLNNLRDIDSDRAAGKLTLAARLGPRGARLYHGLLLAGALIATLLWLEGLRPRPAAGSLLIAAAVAIVLHAGSVLRQREASAYHRSLKRLLLLTAVFELGLAAVALSAAESAALMPRL